MRMNSETRSELFLTASRMLCEVATLLEHCSAPDSDAEPTEPERGYSIEVLDAEEELLKTTRSRNDTLRILGRVFRAGREEASEEMFARGYAAGRCEMEAAKTTLGGGRASDRISEFAMQRELARQKEELDLAQHDVRKQAAAQKLADLIVMRDGAPVEDQAAGIAEFKERYGYLDKTHVAEKRAGNLARSQAAADLAGDNVRPMNPAFRYRGEFRDRAPTAEYPGD